MINQELHLQAQLLQSDFRQCATRPVNLANCLTLYQDTTHYTTQDTFTPLLGTATSFLAVLYIQVPLKNLLDPLRRSLWGPHETSKAFVSLQELWKPFQTIWNISVFKNLNESSGTIRNIRSLSSLKILCETLGTFWNQQDPRQTFRRPK